MRMAAAMAAMFALIVFTGAVTQAQTRGAWPDESELIRAVQRNPESFVAALDTALDGLDAAVAQSVRTSVWAAMFPASKESADPDAAKLESVITYLQSQGRDATIETRDGSTVIVIAPKAESEAEPAPADGGTKR